MSSFSFPENRVLSAIRRKETALGIYIETPSSTMVELAAAGGFDFVRIDWCHNSMDLPALEKCILAAERWGITPMVRIQYNHPDLARILEMGIMGVIIPDMDSADKARAAVQAVKFDPLGDRGLFSASRQSGYGAASSADYVRWTNENVLIGVQIESVEGIARLDEILRVDGIDLVLSGRGDLSNSLGLPGQKNHPDVLAAEEKIFARAAARGKCISPQLEAGNPALQSEITKWNQRGAYAISLGVDTALIKSAFSGIVLRAKG